MQVRVQVTWRSDRWQKVLHIKLFGIVHVGVPTVIMFGVSSLLCSLLISQLLYIYLEMLVCLLMLSLEGDQRLQFLFKSGQFICRMFVLLKVFQVSWNLCLNFRHFCHTSRVPMCTYPRESVVSCLDLKIIYLWLLSLIYASFSSSHVESARDRFLTLVPNVTDM